MPELPEVETTRRGISPHIIAERIIRVIVREGRLRWPVPTDISQRLSGQTIRRIDRRGKYLLFYTDANCLLIHLGMSGSLRIIKYNQKPEKHDHVDMIFGSGTVLRFRDPRRFGSMHIVDGNPLHHKLLAHLGPEPLEDGFTGDYLFQCSRGKKQAVKNFIMDSQVVVGVGNIYANEALYLSGILPRLLAGRITRKRYDQLVPAVKSVLEAAIRSGGTTLRDFTAEEGQPGYFSQELQVYGRDGQDCIKCHQTIKKIQLGQRATYFCKACQK